MNNQFDLDLALAAWRNSLAYNPAFDVEDLDELAQHVRDQVAGLVAEGVGEEAAFRVAMREMGDHGGAEDEYRKVYWGKLRRRHRLAEELGWRTAMLKNYLTITLRRLRRRPLYTCINIFGLAVGMAAFWLILQYVRFEQSYDTFHANQASLYRVHYQQYKGGILELDNAAAVPAVGPAMKDHFPQVVDYARVIAQNSTIVSYQNQSYREDRIREVDPSFLKLFTFPLVKGDAATALAEPNTAVITEATARKYFGNGDPIGKVVLLDGAREVEIRGICRDVPLNSHFTFDFLVSLAPHLSPKMENAGWYWYDFYTYVQLAPGADPTTLQATLNSWVARERGAAWEREGLRQVFSLQPVTDLHLHSDRSQELEPEAQGDAQAVRLLLLAGGLILAIAWANYVNLTTARSMERVREIGVRKVIGAHALQLKGQFLVDATLVHLTATTIAAGLVLVATPWLEQLTGRPVLSPGLVLGLTEFGIILTGSLLSGLYPALVLSRLDPVPLLKGYVRSIAGGARLRQGLVMFQFMVSIVLLIGAATVYRQLAYLRAKDLGITLEQMLVLREPGVTHASDSVYAHTIEAFKAELLKRLDVRRVTASSSVPGQEIVWMNTITPASTAPPGGENTPASKAIRIIGIDLDYLPAYRITLLAGRNFTEAFRLDRDALILNNAASRLLGYANPDQAVGRLVDFRGKLRPIIGVVDDYNHVSPKAVVDPIVFTYHPAGRGYVSLSITSPNIRRTVEQVKDVYLSFFPDSPFEYHFLDDAFNRQYEADLRFGRLIGVFTCLALLVACLGLFGLAMYAAGQRTKEIGVRKALGASVMSIVILISTGFLKPVGLAFLIGAPLAYVAMERWLQDFAYRIDLGPGLFLLAGGLALSIALLTVSYQAIKAALADPVKSLRYE